MGSVGHRGSVPAGTVGAVRIRKRKVIGTCSPVEFTMKKLVPLFTFCLAVGPSSAVQPNQAPPPLQAAGDPEIRPYGRVLFLSPSCPIDPTPHIGSSETQNSPPPTGEGTLRPELVNPPFGGLASIGEIG